MIRLIVLVLQYMKFAYGLKVVSMVPKPKLKSYFIWNETNQRFVLHPVLSNWWWWTSLSYGQIYETSIKVYLWDNFFSIRENIWSFHNDILLFGWRKLYDKIRMLLTSEFTRPYNSFIPLWAFLWNFSWGYATEHLGWYVNISSCNG